ncbi:PE family protein, partial [Mycobacterium szulgai]|uniref:PE family protein n=1 Tax=Mycobacterium szulgai TaxID=1787 RepID=UPI003557735A
MTAAATDITGIGSAISVANLAAAAATTQLLPAAGDEVSAQIAALFSGWGQQYQDLSTTAATFNEQFARTVALGSNLYELSEGLNNFVLALQNGQDPFAQLNARYAAVVGGRPLIGNGANGAAGTGANGQDGGWLFGNGGNGGSGGIGQNGGNGGAAGLFGHGGNGGGRRRWHA